MLTWNLNAFLNSASVLKRTDLHSSHSQLAQSNSTTASETQEMTELSVFIATAAFAVAT